MYIYSKPKIIRIISSSVKITQQQYNATLQNLKLQYLNGLNLDFFSLLFVKFNLYL